MLQNIKMSNIFFFIEMSFIFIFIEFFFINMIIAQLFKMYHVEWMLLIVIDLNDLYILRISFNKKVEFIIKNLSFESLF